MSSDDSRNPEKTLEDPPEDEACRDLVAGMRQGGPPKFHARTEQATSGERAAAYSHEARVLRKGTDTVPPNMSPVLLNVTPVPELAEAPTDPEGHPPPDARAEALLEKEPQVPTEPGIRTREAPRDEIVTFEAMPEVRRTKNVMAIAALVAAAAVALAWLLVGLAGPGDPVSRATPASSATPTASALSALVPTDAPPVVPNPVERVPSPETGRDVLAPPPPHSNPPFLRRTLEASKPTKEPVAPPPPGVATPASNVPGLEDLLPPTRSR